MVVVSIGVLLGIIVETGIYFGGINSPYYQKQKQTK
jgi:hypothetical protein